MAELMGKSNSPDGVEVQVRVTGFGQSEGALMARAKGKAISSVRFGRDTANFEKVTDVQGSPFDETEGIFADKSDALFSGPASGVRDRLKAFRKNGLFAEVKKINEVDQERVFDGGELEDKFGPLASVVNTYHYTILVTTQWSMGR